MTVPHVQPGDWPAIREGRFASRIVRGAPRAGCVALLGLPDDTGVRLNGGRPGAKEGPRAFRAALAGLGAAAPAGFEWPPVVDVGDVPPAGDDLDRTHERVTEAAAAILDAGALPVAVGGGHDLTFAFVRAAAARHRGLAGLSLDAHLDVRAEPGSGMPMRALMERCDVRRIDVLGLHHAVNSAEHEAWFGARGGVVRPERDATGVLAESAGPLFVTLDLDVIDAAHAPGVSAMNPAGWSAAEAARAARAAGGSARVVCFDLMELSPPHDEGGRTARLAAFLFLEFLRGRAGRRP